ncbi:MAG: prolyl oligopeptidase family serine peptidase [Ilumatobacteraceae bacterium]
MSDTFPRQYARTQRFTLGDPRNVTVSPDGARVVFARSTAGDDPVNALWVLDTDGPTSSPRRVADPIALLGVGDDSSLPEAERRRRERMREGAAGVTGYACDGRVHMAAFTLSGRLFITDLVADAVEGNARELEVDGPVFDPVPDPLGTQVAYVCGPSLRVAALDGTSRVVASEPTDDNGLVTWGSAEFIAAEEMGRHRGFWWSPDGTRLAVCRVDNTPVPTWWIADPANPDREPTAVRYPAAGTANADVSLHVVDAAGTGDAPLAIIWDRDAFPYLATVSWPRPDTILLSVQSRDQRRLRVLTADPSTGATQVLAEDSDGAWVELVPGTPALAPSGALVRCTDAPGHRALVVGSIVVSPPDVQVRAVLAVLGSADSGDEVIVAGNPLDDATVMHAYRCRPGAAAERLTDGDAIHGVTAGGATLVVRRATLDAPGAVTTVSVPGRTPVVLDSYLATPLVRPAVHLRRYGARSLATAVLLPEGHDGSPLPALLDPYGGPHAQRVVRSSNAHLTSQWFADQGFAVVVTDGRGTPGRGAVWERAVHLDLATSVLDDQVDALHAAADEFPLDLTRVGIRGWSFGGYLAALAVIRRPDVFHAAVAGAPVTEWRLYDTHYTERYLGDPSSEPGPYDATSLVTEAARLTRPLLLVHGLADDNVVAAHTLQLSSALLAAGRPHEVLPLVGVTHMTPQEVVAENLLLHQLEFLRRHLA